MSIETNNKLVGKLGSSNIKGSGISVKGETGNGIDKIEKTNSVGLIDTYTIYFTDGNTTTFTITNGKNGIDGVNGTNGENGKSLQFNWNGTQLGIRIEGSTEYTYVDLKGNKGDKGDKGDPGEVTLEQLNTTIGNATKTTQTTEVSEALTIENCAPVSAKLDIKSGKSEQATRSGKNKLDIKSFTETTNGKAIMSEIDNGFRITKVGTNVYGNIFNLDLKANTEYCISANAFKSDNCSLIRFIVVYTDDTKNYTSYTVSDGKIKSILAPISAMQTKQIKTIQPYIQSTDEDGAYFELSNIQIEEGTIATEYETYGVMPSPDYPSRIRNIGDNINLFINELQNKTLNGITMQKNQDGSMVFNGTATENTRFFFTDDFVLNIIKGDYTVSCDWTGNITGTMYINVNTSSEALTYFKLLEQKNKTFSITENKLCRGYFYIYKDTVLENLIVYPKLEKGTTPTPYTPYNCGSADFKVQNKNLASTDIIKSKNVSVITNITKNSFTIDLSLGVISSLGGVDVLLGDLNPNEQYTLSYKFKQNNNNFKPKFTIYYTDGTSTYAKIEPNTINEEQKLFATSILGKTIDKIIITWSTQNSGGIAEFYDIQLEKGDTQTQFIQHQEQIKSFPFTEGQVLHKGDYLAQEGIHQVRKKLIINGTEDLTFNTTYNSVYLNITNLNMAVGSNANIICNRLKTADKSVEGINYISSNSIYIKIDGLTTLEEYKAKFAEWAEEGNPLTIEGNVVTEEIIPYTTEQEQAYYELQHLLMYEGYTSIECIDEIKPDIQLTYWYNNELNKSYAKRIDSLEEKIRLLEKAVSSQSGVSE